ncbi:hypothetical protein B0T20DRAFT_146773 [Sordaria brevicollis]|uniref:Uncharacterized protein n=1 Tax=Sordaria brevicollis TaxID=83679 RepID=A0AAE0PIK4_SORBR|nr:hypothetical protein B0T20DRAFT_146773 [Sordaria brevicollis]
MWSSNPNIKVMPQGAAPSSPPLSPGSSRKGSPWHGPAMPPHHHVHNGQFSPPPMPSITVLRPPGLHGGPSFSFTRAIDPDQLSPQSRSTSSETSDSENDGDDPGPSMQPSPSPSRSPSPSSSSSSRPVERIVTNPNLVVEEILSDDDGNGDDDDDHQTSRVPLPIMYPDAIEYADEESSGRSRSRPPRRRYHDREVDERVTYDFGQLNCSDSDSDVTDIEEAEHREILKRQREERRRKRMTSGSIGKRTFAERSDSDVEDEPRRSKRFFGAEQLGSSPSTRRIFQRRVTGDGRRRSVQVSEPTMLRPPRIDEIEEPESSNEEITVEESPTTTTTTWTREMPYYECVMMDIDSS